MLIDQIAEIKAEEPPVPEGPQQKGISIDPEMIFSDHRGVQKPGIEKRQQKLLSKLGFLIPFLEADEQVLLVTTGCSPMNMLEQFAAGWIIIYLKRAVFVFTNKRVFHIPTKADFTYRQSISHFYYSDCRSIRMSGRTLVVGYHTGKTEKFYYIDRRERKKLKQLFAATPLPQPTGQTGSRIHLCPHCGNELQPRVYVCNSCGQPFKNRDKARTLATWLPGGGYFYTGHPFLGIGDALGETYLTVLTVLSAVAAVLDAHPGALTTFFFIGLILALEKLVSVYEACHFVDEYIPIKE